MLASSELISLVKAYDPNANENLLKKAYIFAMEAHGMQRRASGAPYFYHPVEVANILVKLHLDVPTIATGLLHDVLEDTNTSPEELEEIFGVEIATLVKGITKISKNELLLPKVRNTENFIRFLGAMAGDVRVLIVKLADRLQNVRTLNYFFSEEKRKRIALETLEIYSPLAERIGLNDIKDEMEDLAFFNLHPNEYHIINQKLMSICSKDDDFIQNTILELKILFNEAGIQTEILGRKKSPYSIWKKMQKRNISFEQINDVIAFRVIVERIEQCYQVLGVIHTNFPIIPGRFKDYISIPKLNNYRSLHTMVIGPRKQPIEVQIRTKDMDEVATRGIAAHWSYKNNKLVNIEGSWMGNILTVMQNSKKTEEAKNNPDAVMKDLKLGMFSDEVFCFTPTGELISLPKGSTAVDFAYWVHTDIGNSCAGVRINNKIMPLRTVLRNGDQVDIITSPYKNPEPEWEKFVITGKAKSSIRKFIRSKEETEFRALGFQLVQYVFASLGVVFNEESIDLKKADNTSLEEFYYAVGKGEISMDEVELLISDNGDNSENNKNTKNDLNSERGESGESKQERDFEIFLINFTPGIAIHFADCCHPILNDKIVGKFEPQKGLIIHVANCSELNWKRRSLIRVRWNLDDSPDSDFTTQLRIVTENETGGFATVANTINQNGGRITNLKVENRSNDFFEMVVDVKVSDMSQLGNVQAALRTAPHVKSVRRLRQKT